MNCMGGIRELFRFIRADTSSFVSVRLKWALLLVVAAATLSALGPIALKMAVDSLTDPSYRHIPITTALIGLYVISRWLARTLSEIQGLVYARAERRVLRSAGERLFAHVMRLPLRFHLDRQTGALGQALQDGLQGYQTILHHLVSTLLPLTVELATVVVILARLTQPVFLVLFCGALVCYSIAFVYSIRNASPVARRAATAQIAASAFMTDCILNFETVKCFTAESMVQEKLSQSLAGTESAWVEFYRRYALNGAGAAAIFAIFLGATILSAANGVEGGRMTVGDFVLVNTYMLQLLRPVEMFGYAVHAISQGAAMLEKMLDVFREIPEGQVALNRPSTGLIGAVDFEGVCLSYTRERSVLENVSFRVPAGKTLGIVGSTGSGKSTIVRLLLRLVEPGQGRILLDGVPIQSLSLRELREAIAVVPQEPLLFDDTIAYNIGFGRRNATQDEIESAAQLAQLHEFILDLPEQYRTRVGERGIKLSGGEKQRLSIARAIIRQPRIYVFDEATSNLDSVSERAIVRNLLDLCRMNTRIVVAHRLSAVVHADEIVVLESGAIIERGTHAMLLQRKGRYAALWAAQQPDLVGGGMKH